MFLLVDVYILEFTTILLHSSLSSSDKLHFICLDTGADKADWIMKRVRLNINTKSVEVEDWPNLLNVPMLRTVDFPVINNDYTGYKNRYTYGWVSVDYWKQTLVK